MKTKLFALLGVVCILMGGTGLLAAAEKKGEPEFIRIGTASLGGNFFPMGSAIAVVIDQTVPGVKASAQASGGSAFNINAIQQGEMEMGLSQSTAVAAAMNGTGQFKGVKIDAITTIANFLMMPNHILIRADKNIKSLKDLKGMSLEMLAVGDGVEVSSRKIVEAVGLSWENDIKKEYSGNRVQAASRLKTGQVDGIIDGTGIGNSWVVDVIGKGRFKLYNMSDEEMRTIIKKNPELKVSTIPAGTYKGQDMDIHTVAGTTVVLATKALSEKLGYEITKNLFDNKRFLVKSHNFFSDLAPENIKDAIIAPLHPGAKKYYKEKGILP